jgi:hypothetical protein
MRSKKNLVYSFLIIGMFACNSKNEIHESPELIDLEWIDSLEVIEKNEFFSGSSDVQLIGDSLIAVSSFLTPGVWFIDVNNGEIKHRIADRDIMDIQLFPAGIHSYNFPILEILDPRQSSIFVFDVVQKSLLQKVKLELPSNKMIKTVDSFFWVDKNHYYIELFPSLLNHNSLEFYSDVDELIGVFDKNGKMNDKFLTYPSQLKQLDFHIKPYQTFAQSSNPNFPFKISFPASGDILEINDKSFSKETLYSVIPGKSKFFHFAPARLEKEFNPEFQKNWQVPSSHFFKKIVENEKYLIIQTIMRNNDNLENYEAKSHLFIYDKEKKKWLETTNPLNINHMGYLAGILKNELIFFEGGQNNSESKYIKRAVLRPIED